MCIRDRLRLVLGLNLTLVLAEVLDYVVKLIWGADVKTEQWLDLVRRTRYEFLHATQRRLLMKLFNTGSADIVREYCVVLNIRSVSSLAVSRKRKFLTKFPDNRNSICGAVSGLARRELNDLIWLYLYPVYMLLVCLFVAFFLLSLSDEIKLNI